MKPIPIFLKTEHHLLKEMVKNSVNAVNSKDIMLLNAELERGIVVKDQADDENFIRLNSKVTVEDLSAKRKVTFQIVLPSMANVRENKISVLAPLSIAIIGFKENDQIDWELPAGTKTFKVISVKNESEN
ncbi:GreA/GreB family elongation factor [Flavobacterium suncheonense]|uniref:Gramicidin synthase n=1 Tax=Flavobacterium suncheonense GH29-5 = DSM 17707 TaxID=1121899 RepID=A0A0A2MGZ1_9FLAO|nr:GreA/GreB family elongation factor [Flavobacterium suncheonense]KGO90698.1 gramicidin synthase [Flavobacterium suncheonense GH29-5 = DSM 17707]